MEFPVLFAKTPRYGFLRLLFSVLCDTLPSQSELCPHNFASLFSSHKRNFNNKILISNTPSLLTYNIALSLITSYLISGITSLFISFYLYGTLPGLLESHISDIS